MFPRRIGRPGLLGTMARTAVIAGTATAVSSGIQRRAQTREYEREQAEIARQQAYANQAAPAMSTEDRVAKIKALGELRDQGLLTEEEFAAEKAKVLAT